jgi:hypothetical protein
VSLKFITTAVWLVCLFVPAFSFLSGKKSTFETLSDQQHQHQKRQHKRSTRRRLDLTLVDAVDTVKHPSNVYTHPSNSNIIFVSSFTSNEVLEIDTEEHTITVVV